MCVPMFRGACMAVAVAMIVAGCTRSHETDGNSAPGRVDPHQWTGLEQFHTLMAKSFHPYYDSGNLEPAKRLAGDMADQAGRWAASAIPDKVNTARVKRLLNDLKIETLELDRRATAGDSTLGPSLEKVHDLFHAIQEAWNSAGE